MREIVRRVLEAVREELNGVIREMQRDAEASRRADQAEMQELRRRQVATEADVLELGIRLENILDTLNGPV